MAEHLKANRAVERLLGSTPDPDGRMLRFDGNRSANPDPAYEENHRHSPTGSGEGFARRGTVRALFLTEELA